MKPIKVLAHIHTLRCGFSSATMPDTSILHNELEDLDVTANANKIAEAGYSTGCSGNEI